MSLLGVVIRFESGLLHSSLTSFMNPYSDKATGVFVARIRTSKGLLHYIKKRINTRAAGSA